MTVLLLVNAALIATACLLLCRRVWLLERLRREAEEGRWEWLRALGGGW